MSGSQERLSWLVATKSPGETDRRPKTHHPRPATPRRSLAEKRRRSFGWRKRHGGFILGAWMRPQTRLNSCQHGRAPLAGRRFPFRTAGRHQMTPTLSLPGHKRAWRAAAALLVARHARCAARQPWRRPRRPPPRRWFRSSRCRCRRRPMRRVPLRRPSSLAFTARPRSPTWPRAYWNRWSTSRPRRRSRAARARVPFRCRSCRRDRPSRTSSTTSSRTARAARAARRRCSRWAPASSSTRSKASSSPTTTSSPTPTRSRSTSPTARSSRRSWSARTPRPTSPCSRSIPRSASSRP